MGGGGCPCQGRAAGTEGRCLRDTVCLSPVVVVCKRGKHGVSVALSTCPQSFTADLQKFTKDHGKMKCYGLGLALNTWKVVALTEHFRKLEMDHLEKSYAT